MTDPTPAELVRRIEDVVRAMERLTSTLEQNYVRKDVYNSDRRGDLATLRGEIKDVNDAVVALQTKTEKEATDHKAKTEKADTFRRQIIAGVAVAFLAQVFQLFITFNVVRGG